MTLIDIKKAINQALKKDFPKIERYSRETKEGFKRPAFFIELLPIMREQRGKYHYFRKITVLIRYFSESESETELENLKIQDGLEETFGQVLKVKDRVITLSEVEGRIIDEVLQFQFDISYLDSLKEDKVYGYEETELMEELEMKLSTIKEE